MSIKTPFDKEFTMKQLPIIFSLLIFAFATPAGAQPMEHMHHDVAESVGPAAMSSGEVVNIDKGTAKITLRHGPLANLGMPGMTMAFRVADPAMLEQVKPGDKVEFVAERVDGTLSVTTLKAANSP
jgi:Cu(I)/Ag(I) efflux system protein CusF